MFNFMTARVLIASTVLLLGLSASASTPSVRSDRAASRALEKIALALPEKLSARKIEKVGDLSISEVMKETKGLHWKVVQDVLFAGSGGRRASSIFLTESRTVFINALYWRQTGAEVKPILLLHEALGAIGFDDEEYQLSLGLWLLSQNSRVSLSPEKTPWLTHFADLRRSSRTPKYIQLAGGATGVGGGGDQFELTLKMGLLKRIEQLFRSVTGIDRKVLEQSRELILSSRVVVDYDSAVPEPSIYFSRGFLIIRFSPFQLATPESTQHLIDLVLSRLGSQR